MATAPKLASAPAPDVRGRVDVLFLRIGELLTRRIETGLGSAGVTVNLWDGSDGVRAAVEQFCDAQGLTGLVVSPVAIAQRAGLLKRRKTRRKKVGA
jgi:hypothetical protein